MYAQQFGLLLFVSQIILNRPSLALADRNPGRRRTIPWTTRRPILPEDYVPFPELNAAYKVHEVNSTWYEARDRCRAEGGWLAIADTVQKIARINAMKTPAFKWLHVGFYRSNDFNAWVRVDNGFPVTSIPWLGHNPDGTGDCAGISVLADALVDYPCHWGNEWFVCEVRM